MPPEVSATCMICHVRAVILRATIAEPATAALICGGKAYAGTADKKREAGTAGMDQVEEWMDGGAFIAQERLLVRVTEIESRHEGRLVRTLMETLPNGTERIMVLQIPKANRIWCPRLQKVAMAQPLPVFSLTTTTTIIEEKDEEGWAPTASGRPKAVVEWGPQTSTYGASTYIAEEEGEEET